MFYKKMLKYVCTLTRKPHKLLFIYQHLYSQGTQTTYYGRLKLSRDKKGSGTRDGIGGYRRHARKNSLAAGVLAGVNPRELGHETVTAQMLVQGEVVITKDYYPCYYSDNGNEMI